MAISYQSIRTQRQWRASTGLTQKQFEELTIAFAKTYEDFHESTLQEQISERTDDPKFKTYEDILFFILYTLKSGLTYDLLVLISLPLTPSFHSIDPPVDNVRFKEMLR